MSTIVQHARAKLPNDRIYVQLCRPTGGMAIRVTRGRATRGRGKGSATGGGGKSRRTVYSVCIFFFPLLFTKELVCDFFFKKSNRKTAVTHSSVRYTNAQICHSCFKVTFPMKKVECDCNAVTAALRLLFQ